VAEVSTIGLDIAKQTFQAHGADASGRVRPAWRVVLDILVQDRRNATAAKRFFKRLLQNLQYKPRWNCQLIGDGPGFCGVAECTAGSCCPLDVRLLPPDPEGLGACIPILRGGHQMSVWTEVVLDHAVR
jgi:hypothetical protein